MFTFTYTYLQQVLSEFAPDSHSVPVNRVIHHDSNNFKVSTAFRFV